MFQLDAVDADFVINHQNPEWWSFYDVNPLNVSRCEGLTGPTAIVVSEETPRKYDQNSH